MITRKFQKLLDLLLRKKQNLNNLISLVELKIIPTTSEILSHFKFIFSIGVPKYLSMCDDDILKALKIKKKQTLTIREDKMVQCIEKYIQIMFIGNNEANEYLSPLIKFYEDDLVLLKSLFEENIPDKITIENYTYYKTLLGALSIENSSEVVKNVKLIYDKINDLLISESLQSYNYLRIRDEPIQTLVDYNAVISEQNLILKSQLDILKYLDTNNKKYLDNALKILNTAKNSTLQDIKNVTVDIQSIAVKKIREKNLDYFDIYLDCYYLLDKNGLILENGYIRPVTFTNMVLIMLKANKVDLAQEFWKKYHPSLPESYFDKGLHILMQCYIRVYTNQSDNFEKAQKSLINVKTDIPPFVFHLYKINLVIHVLNNAESNNASEALRKAIERKSKEYDSAMMLRIKEFTKQINFIKKLSTVKEIKFALENLKDDDEKIMFSIILNRKLTQIK